MTCRAVVVCWPPTPFDAYAASFSALRWAPTRRFEQSFLTAPTSCVQLPQAVIFAVQRVQYSYRARHLARSITLPYCYQLYCRAERHCNIAVGHFIPYTRGPLCIAPGLSARPFCSAAEYRYVCRFSFRFRLDCIGNLLQLGPRGGEETS